VHEYFGIAKKHKPHKRDNKGDDEKSYPDIVKSHRVYSGFEDKVFCVKLERLEKL
jgi:hypothetical protein